MKNNYKILIFALFIPVSTVAQSRNDAGLRGDAGATSGFFDANVPVNFPAGANSWWHLLDVRHSNTNNNYAMQFSGSFFDQNLFFRKTNDNASHPWSKVLLETDGKVGIGTSSPIAKIDVRGGVVSSEYGVINPILNVFSNNTPEIGTGASIALGGQTNNVTPEYAFAYLTGAKESDLTNNYAGYFSIRTVSGGNNGEVQSANYERFRITSSGDVGIGTTDPKGYKLAVAGNMIAESVKIKLQGTWPDYVFARDYQLPTLQETEKHIKDKGHLPGIPSAAEVKANGIDLGKMNAKLLQKIEELTLHLIEIEKRAEQQQKEINRLKSKLK